MIKFLVLLILTVSISGCAAIRERISNLDVEENKSVTSNRYGPDCLPKELVNSLRVIERKFGKVTVISTYRPGAIIAGTNRPSMHASCRAIDFHPPKGTYRKVVNWLRYNTNHKVITYSGRFNHIHIDNSRKGYFHKNI